MNNQILSHLVILIKNIKGYENLCQIISKSHMERKDLPPAVEASDLKRMSKGLIGLGCCEIGEISTLVRAGRIKEALQSAIGYQELFRGDFFLEIQRYPKAKSDLCASSLSEILINFAHENELPIVATNNVHYLNKEDYQIYKYLARIKAMGVKSDAGVESIDNNEHYFKPASEMASMFSDIPQAISNTRFIADRCNLEFSLGNISFPCFKAPEDETQESYLKKLCCRGLKQRYGNNPSANVCSRLEKELEIITKTGFCGYFLIVADIARFAHKNNIPICGKGSSAGSIVSYILGISSIDPVKNNLYFERFLNRERKEPPDIDIDLSAKRRTEIIRYLTLKYGKNNISRVCTFSTLKPRAAIREAGRILGLGKEDMDQAVRAVKAVPDSLRYPRRQDAESLTVEPGHIEAEEMQYKKITYISGKIENYIRHTSMHPSAFIVSSSNLAKKIPLALSETGEIMSQYDMNSIEDLGLLKIDLINSLSLSLLEEVADMLRSKRNINLNIREIKYDDEKTFNLIKSGKTLGVFQLESFGIRKLAKKVKPLTLNDITLLISLYRPGPQQSGMVKNFIERKSGREKTVYLHQNLEPILSETYGIILYQEQVMQIAASIAGYSLSEADSLRKAMTGLSKEEMENQAARFLKGAVSKGYRTNAAKEIFKLISKFASYGFVKAHAAAYAELSYKTCYIKAHYPAELISVVLTNNSGYYSRAQYIEEARRFSIKIKLPHINKSEFKFSVEDEGESIRISLLTVKELGYTSVSSIINERRKNGDFKDFHDFYYRISENRRITEKAIENLIKVGAFDFTGLERKYLLLTYHYLKNLKNNKNIPGYSRCLLLKNKNYSKDFNLEEKLEIEEKILGFCASRSPLQYFRSELEEYHTVESGHFPDFISSKKNIFTAGIIITRKIKKTRDGKNMLLCTIEDGDGMYESVFFPDVYKKNSKIIMDQSAIIIEGRLCFKDGEISVIGRNVVSLIHFKKIKSRTRKDSVRNNLLTEVKSAWEI
ncbi:DNA polymerase III subunit alpha [subsurface metagenome]